MTSADQINFIFLVEFFYKIGAKYKAGAARTIFQTLLFIIRVTPQKVTHGASMWHLLLSVQTINIVQNVYRRTESAMHTKNPIFD